MAKVGDQLLQPEPGWKRYDDSFNRIEYIGESWKSNSGHPSMYRETYKSTTVVGSMIKFKFSRSKIRILAYTNNNSNFSNSSALVKIDGNNIGYLQLLKSQQVFQCIVFECIGLEDGIHLVEIINTSNHLIAIDAIDIDENGDIYKSNVTCKCLLKNNSNNKLLTIQNDTLILLNEGLSPQIYDTNGFDNVSSICNEFAKTSTNSNSIEIDTGKCFEIPILDDISSIESVVIE